MIITQFNVWWAWMRNGAPFIQSVLSKESRLPCNDCNWKFNQFNSFPCLIRSSLSLTICVFTFYAGSDRNRKYMLFGWVDFYDSIRLDSSRKWLCDDVNGDSISKLENFLITKSVKTGFRNTIYRNSLSPFLDFDFNYWFCCFAIAMDWLIDWLAGWLAWNWEQQSVLSIVKKPQPNQHFDSVYQK